MQHSIERKLEPGNNKCIHFNKMLNTTVICHIKETLAQCAQSQHRLLVIFSHDLTNTANDLSSHILCITKNGRVIVPCSAKCLHPPVAVLKERKKSLQAVFRSCTGVAGFIFIFKILFLKYYLNN